MPGLNPLEMNGMTDMGYMREDMEDPYRRPMRNGSGRPPNDRFNDHLADQHSLSDFNSSEPAFELDHLATFAAGGSRRGTMHVEDGLRKLRQMESTTGIWTMRCILLVERRFIVILDKNSGEELERFPVHYVQEPTAIFKNDRREIYNNLILFTVMDESSNKKDAQADMHIFQSVRTPAQNIVDEMFAAKRGQARVSSGGEAEIHRIIQSSQFRGQAGEGESSQAHEYVSKKMLSNHQQIGQSLETGHHSLDDYHARGYISEKELSKYLQAQNASAADHTRAGQAGAEDAQLAHGYVSRKSVTNYWQSQNASHADQSRETGQGRDTGHITGVDSQAHELASRNKSSKYRQSQKASTNELSRSNQVHSSQSASNDRYAQSASLGIVSPDVIESEGPPPVPGRHALSHSQQQTSYYQQTQDSQDLDLKKENWYKIPPPPSGPAPEPPGSRDPYDFGGFRETIEHRQYNQFGASQFNNGGGFIGGAQRSSMMARPSYLPYREREDEIGSNELLERDVQLLNHCFDDIEKFVARLQQAAESYKELEKRKRERGGKGKKVVSGDGMLAHRARPPPAQDFVDIFQKFKLSFNLLAKLKAYIHDPNAPELVHFLFTPLSLIYEASRDPVHGSMNLGEQAAAPVLTHDAKQLLVNCLTSKEIELWQALGKNWTTSKDEWKGYVPPYVPKFYDGWQPAPTLVDEMVSRPSLDVAVANHQNQIRNRAHEQDVRDYVSGRVMPFPPDDKRFHREQRHMQEFEQFEPDPRATTPPRNVLSNSSVAGFQQYVEQHIDRNYRTNDIGESRRAPPPLERPSGGQSVIHPSPPLDDNMAYLEELKRTGAMIYEVQHDRQGKNQKELTVAKGDILQVLENSRNWWKVRNCRGEVGFCPFTMLKEISSGNTEGGNTNNASTDQAAPADKKSSRRGDTSSDGGQGHQGAGRAPLLRFLERPTASPEPPDNGSRVDELSLPSLDDEDRHAFRPVESQHPRPPPAPVVHKKRPQDDLHNELRQRMGVRPPAPTSRRGERDGGGSSNSGAGGGADHSPGDRATSASSRGSGPQHSSNSSNSGSVLRVVDSQPSAYITMESSQKQVMAWLQSKAFSSLCQQTLQGFTGRDLLGLHRQEMEQLLGHEEAVRLEGQLVLQKKMTGYRTQSAAELSAIFQKRRARADQQGTQLGHGPPDFRPRTPDCDVPDSDSDSDDRQLAQTGKTLRDLLIRQRQKIVSSSVFEHPQ